MYIYSTSKNSLHTLDEEFQIQGSIEVKGKSMKAEETDLSFPLSQHDKWHAIRYQLICAKGMVFCLHVGKFPLGEMASFWKPVNNQKHGASRDHCWKNYSVLWFLPLNGACKQGWQNYNGCISTMDAKSIQGNRYCTLQRVVQLHHIIPKVICSKV